jgi:hypothetical protein
MFDRRGFGTWVIGALAAVVTSGSAACRSSTMPTPVETPGAPVQKPVQNGAPVIASITAAAERIEVGRSVAYTAEVQDAETPLANLEFDWTATAGEFEGTGPRVTWHLSPGAAATPLDVGVTLEVVERYPDYTATGTPIVSEHRVRRDAPPVRVHDSPAEIARIAIAFLVDYFGHSAVSPAAAVVDFSDTCPGKAEEQSDIEANRATFTILDATAHVEAITFNPEMTYADVVAPCTFHDRRLDNGQIGTTDGDCLLTSVYAQRRWWLCDSHFRSH